MEATLPPLQALFSLVSCASTGDERAFGELVSRFEDRMLAYARGILGDRHLAEDAVHMAFIEAWRCLHQLREPERFPGWLRSIIFKQCDRITRGATQAMVALHAASELIASQSESAELPLLAALEALPASEREVVRLY